MQKGLMDAGSDTSITITATEMLQLKTFITILDILSEMHQKYDLHPREDQYQGLRY